jgi:hypothetical protein
VNVRSWLYAAARLFGDVQAASQGPVPLVKRRVRARVLAKVNGQTMRVLRKAGL